MNSTLLDILVIWNHGFWKGDTLHIRLRAKRKKFKFIPNVNNRNRGKSIKGVPFVLIYHPKLKSANKILTKNLYLLYMDKEVKKTFTPKPMIAFRSARKLSNFLLIPLLLITSLTVALD